MTNHCWEAKELLSNKLRKIAAGFLLSCGVAKPQEYIRISRIWRTAWRQKDKAGFAIYCLTVPNHLSL